MKLAKTIQNLSILIEAGLSEQDAAYAIAYNIQEYGKVLSVRTYASTEAHIITFSTNSEVKCLVDGDGNCIKTINTTVPYDEDECEHVIGFVVHKVAFPGQEYKVGQLVPFQAISLTNEEDNSKHIYIV